MPNYNESVNDEVHKGIMLVVPKIKSRPVRLFDLFKVLWDTTRIKIAMLFPFPGRYPKAASISHAQYERKKPLRFFTLDRDFGWRVGNRLLQTRTVINPKILWASDTVNKDDGEACMSFPQGKKLRLKRHTKLLVEYWTFFGKRKKYVYEIIARIFQHELDHMECVDYLERKKLGRRGL